MKALKGRFKKELDNSWFRMEEDDGKEIVYSSREYGSVEGDSYGQPDFQEAKRLAEFGRQEGYNCDIYIVDEWVGICIDK